MFFCLCSLRKIQSHADCLFISLNTSVLVGKHSELQFGEFLCRKLFVNFYGNSLDPDLVIDFGHGYNYCALERHSFCMYRKLFCLFKRFIEGLIIQITFGPMQVKRLTLQRLMKEEASIENQPIPNALVARQELLKFYFCLHSLQGSYRQGFYFGLLQLHQNYPFAAPKLFFFTPSGRFDVNVPICTSFTNYHQESWTSAWNVRTLTLATISFMYSQQPAYGCCRASEEERVRMARQSLQFNMRNPIFVRLFEEKLKGMGVLSESQEREGQCLANYTSYVPELQLQENGQEEKESIQGEIVEEARVDEDKRNKRNMFKLIMKIIGLILILAGVSVLAVKFL